MAAQMQIYDSIASRFRPHILGDIIGQERVVTALRGAFKSGRISRTYLISGPWGSGKTTTARVMARYVNCKAREPEADPCGKCDSCKELAKENPQHPDYQELNAADARGIDVIRSIIDQAQFKPKTNFRIFVLDEVHQLTPQAFQALLKILEEPPKQTIFILCTTELQKLPPTIVSRATKLNIQPVAPYEVAQLLRKVVNEELAEKAHLLTDDHLLKISEGVHGHPRDALTALESIINAVLSVGHVKDMEEYLTRVIDEAVANSIDSLVYKFLTGIYTGKFTPAIMALSGSDNHGAFMDSVLKYHEHTIRAICSPKLIDKYFNDWYKVLAEKGVYSQDTKEKPHGISATVLAELLGVFMEASSKLKSYALDGHFVLLHAGVCGTSLVKKAMDSGE